MPICCFHDCSPDLCSAVFSNTRSFCVWACYCGYNDTICYRETYLLFKLSDHTTPHISAELRCAGCLGKRTSFTFLPASPGYREQNSLQQASVLGWCRFAAGRLLSKPVLTFLRAPGACNRAKTPSRLRDGNCHGPCVSASWWELQHGACLLPVIAFNRACNSGDWVFNMWQTSDLFLIPQACLVSFLVTGGWLQSTLSIIQQTYHRVDQWELVLSKLALVCVWRMPRGGILLCHLSGDITLRDIPLCLFCLYKTYCCWLVSGSSA